METPPPSSPGFLPSALLVGAAWLALAAGLATFAGLLATGHEQRAWSAVLQGMLLPLWISVGAVAFLAINHVCGARWIIPLRRVMEGLSRGLWLIPPVIVGILTVGGPYLYEWFASDARRAELFHGSAKATWMQPTRWAVTALASVALWLFLSYRLRKSCEKSDGRIRSAVVLLLVLAPSFTLFVWDLLLSLDARFASTMWGVYCFTGAIQTFLAALVLAVLSLRRGPLALVVREHTLHDLGTWLMAWSAFCGYIGFAQYLVITYTDLSEEARWLLPRLQHGYGSAYVAEALLRVALPFALLLSQSLRTRPLALAIAAGAVLLGNVMDWSWMIAPAFSPNDYRPFWAMPEILVTLGFAGAGLLLALRFWRRHGCVPLGDQQLAATVAGEHLH